MSQPSTIAALPHALSADDWWEHQLHGRVPSVFLDYDGVLTGIVNDPADAILDPPVRDAIDRLASLATVAIISGRDLDDVRAMVDLPGLAYAGSHGFDMLRPDGSRERKGDEYLDDLNDVERRLVDEVVGLDGVRIERKRYAIAVHTRRAPDDDTRDRAWSVVDGLAGQYDRLRVTHGREIWEFRPNIPWDKGRALVRLMDVLGVDAERHPPVYVGDDVTDEDAFAAIVDVGVGVLVAGAEDRLTAARLRLNGPDETPRLLHLLTTFATEVDDDGT